MLSTHKIRSKNVCIQSIDDIHPDYTLAENDIVEFKSEILNIDCKYRVCPTHLTLLYASREEKYQEITNAYIFNKLKINAYQFCENYYGYKSDILSHWPEVHFGDYRALTSVVKEIYVTIKKMEEDAKFVAKTPIDSIDSLTVTDDSTSTIKAFSGLTLNDGNIVITADTGISSKIEIGGIDWYKSIKIDDSNSFKNMFQHLSPCTNDQSNDIECSNELEKDNNGGHVKLKPIKSNIKHVKCDKEIKIKF